MRSVSFAMLLSILCIGLPSLPPSAYDQETARQLRLEPKEGSVNNEYVGTVTMLTKSSITIQPRREPKEPPRTFRFSEPLAAGKIPTEPRKQPGARYEYKVEPEYMYRLLDVKSGDWVKIRYARINGVDICDHLCIRRRPEGLIPPLPKEAENLGDWRKAWKSRHPGLSLPEWMEKTPHTPYHEYWNAHWAKVAPMPREVKPPGQVFTP
jgi:hypothetical protein